VVEDSPDAVIFADRAGVIRIWNARAQALLGYAPDEAIGRSLDLIIPEHLRAAHWRGYHAAIASGRTRLAGEAMRTRATPKGGGKLYVAVAFGIVKDEAGAVLGAVATARPAGLKSPE
jgi:PAS domain S-box-containing protein